ncbi:hypothetical protein E3N88_23068 [Mikania micrantha]|uniref:Uncharacterized protein n=1 Tax=Mikania micrantha TaxID=192012 RepID=A0A5N6NDY9_9ASTR|nr:hypothetical protein E3N88_23068 [Mikania micrantha]
MASSSSSPSDDKKSRLTAEIMKQYNKDALYMDVLKQNFQSLEDGIKKGRTKQTVATTAPNVVRDLVVLFMVDEDKTDVQQLQTIANMIKILRLSGMYVYHVPIVHNYDNL